MNTYTTNSPRQVIQKIIPRNGFFPNNLQYPFLVYKDVIQIRDNTTTKELQHFFKENGWVNSWVDSIYDYHHYHSNTHEALIIFQGSCAVEIGGPNGSVFEIEKGDVIIFPAGVSHKNIHSSKDFKTIGAYPFDINYDMKYGKEKEFEEAMLNIEKVGLPLTDPVFGKNGLIFEYWK